MIGRWWRQRRRRKLRARGLPADTREILAHNVPYTNWLSADQQQRLLDWLPVFLGEKHWSGIRGFELTEEMRVTVAAQVGIVLLGFDEEFLDRLQSIVLSPQLLRENRKDGRSGIVFENSAALGEAYTGGPVRLAWPSVLHGARFPDDGHNVVFHEIAHVLDMHDGFTDGMPPLATKALADRWEAVIKREHAALVQRTRQGYGDVIDSYGATNIGEFFAVSTEAFLESPHELAAYHAEWFELLTAFYQQDPREWVPTG